jgi:radical SAM protein with 4Fe4S-binding SPASM domain
VKLIPKIKNVLRRNASLYKYIQDIYPYVTVIAGLVKSRRGCADHIKSTWSHIHRQDIIAGRPINITIEPTNICNLLCPVCETGDGTLGRPDGHMTFDSFKAIIDKVASHTNTLMFYFMGEPFLNKDAYRMIRYAKDSGIPWVTTCTNGDAVNPEKLIECGLDEINFQIGGMTQETHQTYRVNSKFDRVLRNLEATIRLRNEKKVKLSIASGFIVMKHNEHEVQEFLAYAKQTGIDTPSIIHPSVRTIEQGVKFLTKNKKYWIYNSEDFARGQLKRTTLPNNDCPWIYYSMTVQMNGDVVPCCHDPRGLNVMGNLLEQNLDEIWNGSRFVAFREQLHKDQGSVSICRLCSSYPASTIK